MHNSKLGQWAEIAGAVASGYAQQDQQAPAQQPSGGAGAEPAGPAPPSSGPTSPVTTAISPTFQQAFTPQISPTIQVTTDSPGARVGATTVQRAGGGQYARGGGVGPADDGSLIPSGSGPGGIPYTPLTPPSFRDELYYQPDAVRDVMQVAPFNWTPVIYVAGGLLAIVLFMQAQKSRAPRRAA